MERCSDVDSTTDKQTTALSTPMNVFWRCEPPITTCFSRRYQRRPLLRFRDSADRQRAGTGLHYACGRGREAEPDAPEEDDTDVEGGPRASGALQREVRLGRHAHDGIGQMVGRRQHVRVRILEQERRGVLREYTPRRDSHIPT